MIYIYIMIYIMILYYNDSIDSLCTFFTCLPLILTFYVTMVHLSKLRRLHWYNTLNFSY